MTTISQLAEPAPLLTEAVVVDRLQRTWQPVFASAELPAGAVRPARLLGRELVLARFAGGVVIAADEACPHKGARLSGGCIVNGELRCPYHGWRFDAVGACQSIPSLAEAAPDKLRLAHLVTYPTQERYGFIWVRLALPEGVHASPEPALPDVPEFESAGWDYVIGPPMRFAAGWRREVENFLDMTHFAFAHADTLGKAADHRLPPLHIATLPDGGFQMDAEFPSLASGDAPGKLQSAHHRRQRCWLPNFTTIRQTFPDGDERVLLHVPSPTSVDTCVVYWSLAVSRGFKGPPLAQQIEFAVRVLEEDRQMCESQIPAEIPINPARGGWGVLVMPGDALANTFQKSLRRWLLAGA